MIERSVSGLPAYRLRKASSIRLNGSSDYTILLTTILLFIRVDRINHIDHTGKQQPVEARRVLQGVEEHQRAVIRELIADELKVH